MTLSRTAPAVAPNRTTHTCLVDAALHTGLRGLARAAGVPLAAVLRAAAAVLLSRLGAGPDPVVGAPDDIPARVAVTGNPEFAELLAGHRVVAAPGVPPAASVSARTPDAGLEVTLELPADLLSTVDEMASRLRRVLAAAVSDPRVPVGQIDLLAPTERHRIAVTWNATDRPLPDATVPELVAARAAVTPDATALVFGDERITYAELDTRANRLANHILATAPCAGAPVGICLERGPELVVAVLATLKAGGAYTMLDPDFPATRLSRVLAESGGTLAVTDHALAGLVRESGARLVLVDDEAAAIAACPAGPPAPTAGPESLACVMFTSGSTGKPKGVAAPHRALVGTLIKQSYVDFAPGGVVLQCSPVSWDAFALELFGALLNGGTCVLQPGQHPDPPAIAELVAEHRITTLHLSASLLNFMLDAYPGAFAGVRQLMTGGEPASVAHIARALREYPEMAIVNGYSPVENMIFTLCHRIGVADVGGPTIPVGTPIANKRVHVLDAELNLVPCGVVGELYMSGVGLAHGYLNQPGQTAARFVPDPFGAPGERMYRTGDLVRRRPDGVIEFLGRADAQIKIRGFRVEPGEVETALGRHPSVRRSAVLAREDRPGDKRLVAYVVPVDRAQPRPGELRRHLAGLLPDHLIPSAFVVLDRLPITPNGKLDRAALPAPARRNP
ncbi:non-ribosomal peptide synthetase [Actinophytocola sp.]|uniref:non-ribosomal peptide synthetase n=1 Tax=Actinophytocola sp. TaxID=1872138 RepID=UPI00389988D0